MAFIFDILLRTETNKVKILAGVSNFKNIFILYIFFERSQKILETLNFFKKKQGLNEAQNATYLQQGVLYGQGGL